MWKNDIKVMKGCPFCSKCLQKYRVESNAKTNFVKPTQQLRGHSFMTSAMLGVGGGPQNADIWLTQADVIWDICPSHSNYLLRTRRFGGPKIRNYGSLNDS